jgi:hypothetical protein
MAESEAGLAMAESEAGSAAVEAACRRRPVTGLGGVSPTRGESARVRPVDQVSAPEAAWAAVSGVAPEESGAAGADAEDRLAGALSDSPALAEDDPARDLAGAGPSAGRAGSAEEAAAARCGSAAGFRLPEVGLGAVLPAPA